MPEWATFPFSRYSALGGPISLTLARSQAPCSHNLSHSVCTAACASGTKRTCLGGICSWTKIELCISQDPNGSIFSRRFHLVLVPLPPGFSVVTRAGRKTSSVRKQTSRRDGMLAAKPTNSPHSVLMSSANSRPKLSTTI